MFWSFQALGFIPDFVQQARVLGEAKSKGNLIVFVNLKGVALDEFPATFGPCSELGVVLS